MESMQFDFSNDRALMRDKFIESSIFLRIFCRGEFGWLAWTSLKLILVGQDVMTPLEQIRLIESLPTSLKGSYWEG